MTTCDATKDEKDIAMSKEVGFAKWLFSCYCIPTWHLHSTAHALEARTKKSDDGKWYFDRGPNRDEASIAVFEAHGLLLQMLALQREPSVSTTCTSSSAGAT